MHYVITSKSEKLTNKRELQVHETMEFCNYLRFYDSEMEIIYYVITKSYRTVTNIIYIYDGTELIKMVKSS